jgi:uncharacterized membrane protein YfhO
MQRAGWVVASETAWRGWRAVSDGRSRPLAFANRGYLAFELAAGQHEIDLFYRPRSFIWGLTLSGLTTMLIILGLLVSYRLRLLAQPTVQWNADL